MLASVITAIVSFISTNIDDLFVLMLFFLREETLQRKRQIVIGQSLGIGALVGVSLLGAYALQNLPKMYLGFLGLIPLALGIREWCSTRKKQITRDDPAMNNAIQSPASTSTLTLQVLLLSVANGGDNIGIYIPLFAGYSMGQRLSVVIVFALMTALWCFLAHKLASLSALKDRIQRYQHILVPIVFISLGLFIMSKNWLL